MRTLLLSVVLGLGSALFSTACVGPGPDAPTSAHEEAGELGRFTSGADGFDTHSFYFDTGTEVVVIDAQFTPALAEKVIADIRKKTTSKIAYVVVTHPNPDKFNGASAFQKIGAKVVASASTAKAIPGVHAYKKAFFVDVAKMFTPETYPAEAHIDVTFSGKLTLPLEGSLKVELSELEHPGVSTTQTVVHIPQQKALFVGDLVHHGAHAWLEGGIADGKPHPDLGAWKEALGELLAFPGAIVYGGRGETAPVEQAVSDQRAYLDGMNELVTAYVAGLGDKKNELFGPESGAHMKKISDEAQAKYPERALGYLVEYGVYGLAQQVASAAP